MRLLLLSTIILFSSLSLHAQRKKALQKLGDAREYAQKGELNKALAKTRDAIEEAPDLADSYLLMADIFKKMGLPDSAIASYQQGRRYEMPYYVDLFEGRLRLEEKQYQEAIVLLENYRAHPRATAKYREEATRLIENARFALESEQQTKEFKPINLGPKVNTPDLEYFPSISADGRTLVFTHRKLEGQKLDEDFWVSYRDSSGAPWGEATLLQGQLNSDGNEGAQSLSADGQVIFLAACERPDGFGSCDIYFSYRLPNGSWSKPANLGPAINTHLWESQPSISPDGRTLYFVRGRSGVDKNINIYVSTFSGSGWTKAKPIEGKINTPRQETSPFIHFDDEHLYFSSNGHPGMGDLDFFVSERQADGSWGEPINLGPPYNSSGQDFSLIVAPDGKTGFFSSDAFDEGRMKLDLYQFTLPEEARAKPIAYLRGRVVDEVSRDPISTRLNFVDLADTTRVLLAGSNKDGRFYRVLPAYSDYALSVAKKGYLFYSKNFALAGQTKEQALELLVELTPIASGQKVVLENVFFATDSDIPLPSSDTELEKVYEFLKLNPSIKVRVEGHTDSEGNSAYNKDLSKRRAQAVYQHLVERGISASRMLFEGWGDEKPVADNSTKEGRALNRRTELHILPK